MTTDGSSPSHTFTHPPHTSPPQNGVTALMAAALKGHTAVVEALLKAGASIDLKTEVGVADAE